MLLEIRNLNTWFSLETSAGEHVDSQVLYDVSLSIKPGQTVSLVGESGSGKSVTALTILRLLEEGNRVKNTGSILFEQKEIFDLDQRGIRELRGNRIAMIFQEPMTSLNPVYTIGNQLMEPLLLHRKIEKKQAKKEAIELLDRTGIDNPVERMNVFPHQLSGGQRQRVMIAMALACNPSLLIADEPTTALDVTIQAQILDLIRNIQEEYGMAVLLITHDLAMVKKFTDHIHIMKDGRIVENGPTMSLFSKPQHNYTKHLLRSVPQGTTTAKDASPLLLEIQDLTCHFELKSEWISPFKRKKKIVQAVHEVNLTIYEGTTCGIVGESGSGKTTLGMAILRLVNSKGNIHFKGHPLHLFSNNQMRPLRKELQVIFQDPFSSLSPRLTVEEIIAEGMKIHGLGKNRSERYAIVADTLDEVGLEREMAFRYPHEFSGGQRQRIAIARAIVLKPKFLVLDEPTSALDMTIQAQVIDLLKDLQDKYKLTYMFISHDLRVVRALADQVAVMQHGRIVEAGPAWEIFSSPRQEYTQTLFRAALEEYI